MRKRIAFVKTGWSENYRGDAVVGRHAHIASFEEAHERFNFLPTRNGQLYAYLPPIGPNGRPPQPMDKSGWLVIFVAARNGNGPLTVVGWYDDAYFEPEYTDRPEYKSKNDFPTDVDGNNYVYCVTAGEGHLIQVPDRNITIPGDHFKRTPVVYARGNGMDADWREELAEVAESVVKMKQRSKGNGATSLGFPDQEHRDKVEKAAIKEAIRVLESKKYKVTDRQKDNCGYDLLAKRVRSPQELHVEVKGTSSEVMRFYMSRNEKQYMANPKWRLLMVTNALGSPKASLMTENEVIKTFQFNPFAWEAVCK